MSQVSYLGADAMPLIKWQMKLSVFAPFYSVWLSWREPPQ
jgi:hypothetical protein